LQSWSGRIIFNKLEIWFGIGYIKLVKQNVEASDTWQLLEFLNDSSREELS
jgi:hypothetical protein